MRTRWKGESNCGHNIQQIYVSLPILCLSGFDLCTGTESGPCESNQVKRTHMTFSAYEFL